MMKGPARGDSLEQKENITQNHPKILPKSSMNPWSGKSRSWIRGPFFHDSSVLIFCIVVASSSTIGMVVVSEDWPYNGNHLAVDA